MIAWLIALFLFSAVIERHLVWKYLLTMPQVCAPIQEEWFGKNKTFRGFISLPLLVGLGCWMTSFPVSYPFCFGWVTGFLFQLGELPNSYVKRRLQIPPGAGYPPPFHWIDSIDSVLPAVLWMYYTNVIPSALLAIGILVFVTFVHNVASPLIKKQTVAFNVPNSICHIRLFLLLAGTYQYLQGSIHFGCLFLIGSAILDHFDGMLARRLHQSSIVGSLYDCAIDHLHFICIFMLIFLKHQTAEVLVSMAICTTQYLPTLFMDGIRKNHFRCSPLKDGLIIAHQVALFIWLWFDHFSLPVQLLLWGFQGLLCYEMAMQFRTISSLSETKICLTTSTEPTSTEREIGQIPESTSAS